MRLKTEGMKEKTQRMAGMPEQNNITPFSH